MRFAARYRGICPECDEAIEPGDLVEYRGDRVAHADCEPAGETGRVRSLLGVCPECWLERPCSHDDERGA